MTLQELQISFLQNAKRYLDTQHEKDSMKIPRNIKEACSNMAEYQTKELVLPVQNLCITFLNTSYYMENPILRIWFYAPGMLWKTAMMYQDFDASWLTAPLKQYEEQLEDWAGNQRKSKEWIEVEKRHMLRLLLKLTSYYIKYDILDNHACEELDKMFKSNDFLISFGEYMDWQLPILMERAAIDIFQRAEQDSLHFRTFRDMVYHKKNFINLDLSGSRFYNCRFQKCICRDSVWNDVFFFNCTFEDVVVEGGEMLGTRLQHCKLLNCRKEGVKEKQEEEETITGFYRPAELIDCEVDAGGSL